jgi:murein DD-endopeptidase MepM/ murein hydrolase activator NlpD
MRRSEDMVLSPVQTIEDRRGARRRQYASTSGRLRRLITRTAGGFVTGRGWLGIALAVLLLCGGALAWVRFEGDAPSVEGPASLLIGSTGSVAFDIGDLGSGLREILISIQQADGETVVFERSFPGDLRTGGNTPGVPERFEIEIDPKALGLGHGDASLKVTARDWSWRNSFRGNETQHQVPLTIDLQKPRIQVASGLTYVSRGGSGAVSYSVNEETMRDGVMVGENFYRGFLAPGADVSSGRRFALFAVPTDAPKGAKIVVVAEDRAGNVANASWPVVLKERLLPDANITLPDRFLETKVRNLADAENIPQDDLIRAFDQINTQLRAANEAKIREIVANPSESKLWNGAFGQLRNSKVTSKFAEQRSYFVNGKKISKATHFGYDLASTSGAPIEASNSGVVIFVDDLGIYGNCVIIDHGMDLFSLYAHLSSMSVSVGDRVEKNDTLGLSGATGLAGGDHLHFAILLGGTYVEPLEWWDPVWVKTHVDAHLTTTTR